jgi:hypothetical protein
MYSRLFQSFILDVGPTDEPGMHFSAGSVHKGHILHFGMKQGDMLVVATKGDSRYVILVLPPALFRNSFRHETPVANI